MNYQEEYARSLADPKAFWAQQMELIHWFKQPTSILESLSDGTHRWFADGELNSCYLALDYHLEQGRGDRVALYYDSPVTDIRKQYTYRQLHEEVARFAGALKSLGVGKGDTVIIYMPMVPEAGIAMLACARLGAVHSVVFGGFAPHELAIRVDDAKPKVVLTASCGIEFDKVIEYKPLVDQALEQADHAPDQVVVYQRPQVKASLQAGRDLDWEALCADAEPADCVPVKATDPLYIMYTSGTTGKPKGIVRDNGGHAVALMYALRNVYGMEAGDVWWGCSDVGWVVGHSFIMYGPLMGGGATVFFEGKPIRTPDAGTFWRIIDNYRVKSMFVAPTAFRAIRKADPEAELLERYDISSLERLFVAGEKLDSPTYHWLSERLKVPVIDHWWQTETGWPVTAPLSVTGDLETRLASSSRPVPGFDVQVLDPKGHPLEANENGSIVIKLPLPPGCAQTLWNDHDRYLTSYLGQYPGYYHTGDGGYKDEDGFVYIMGRTDDVINVSGHRLSTGEMEEVVAKHPAVAECAVIGVPDEMKGQVPVGLLLLKDGVTIEPGQLEQEVVALVRESIGAVACFRQALVVERLPKTRSGKILRAVLRKIASGEDYVMPSTIDDASILPEISQTMAEAGVAPQPA